MDRPELVMFTPLPPQRNGIADYAAVLLSALTADYNITVVVDDGTRADPIAGLADIISVFDYGQRFELHRHLHIYQVGNNAGHVYMLPFLVRRPGLVVLHDPSLHHLLNCATVARGDLSAYEEALAIEFGPPGRILAEQYIRLGLRDQAMFSALPAIKGIVGSARGIIVHSQHAAGKVAWQASEAPVAVVPHHASKPQLAAGAREFMRTQLGVSVDTAVLISIGFVTKAKQIDLVLRALAAGKRRLKPFLYVIAGQTDPEEIDVAAIARQLGIADHVHFTGYVKSDEFDALIAASDIVLNLRYPDFGETSGILARALAVGICTIVIDNGSAAEIPDGCVAKLPWGPETETLLTATLSSLMESRQSREQIATKAAQWSLQARSLEAAIAGYRAAINAAKRRPTADWSTRPTAWEMLPRAEISRRLEASCCVEADSPLSLLAGLVPVPAGECRIGIWAGPKTVSRLFATFLNCPITYRYSLSEGMKSTLTRSCDLLFVVASTSELPRQIAGILLAVNRTLTFGGILIGDITRKAEDPFSNVLRRADLLRLLDDTGFRLEDAATTQPPTSAATPHVFDAARERISFRAVKVSEFHRARWPLAKKVSALS